MNLFVVSLNGRAIFQRNSLMHLLVSFIMASQTHLSYFKISLVCFSFDKLHVQKRMSFVESLSQKNCVVMCSFVKV